MQVVDLFLFCCDFFFVLFLFCFVLFCFVLFCFVLFCFVLLVMVLPRAYTAPDKLLLAYIAKTFHLVLR